MLEIQEFSLLPFVVEFMLSVIFMTVGMWILDFIEKNR